MKHFDIFRGKSTVNHKATNGDVYDSSATLTDDVQNGPRTLWHSELVNTDSTIGYKGGRLAKGNYYGIVGYSAKGKRVIKLFMTSATRVQFLEKSEHLTIEMMTVPSEIPNPNHGGAKFMQYVYIHEGYRTTDGSHGCITVYRYPLIEGQSSDWDLLINMLQDNEIITVTLK